HYGDFTQRVDLGATESADQIVDRALAADRRVLVDLPAHSTRTLESWLASANVIEFAKEVGIAVTFWHVCDGGFASVSEIDRSLTQLNGAVQHVVVKNYGRAKDFSQFDESPARYKLEQLAGRVVEVPELDPPTMHRIDRYGLSYWAAVHLLDGE